MSDLEGANKVNRAEFLAEWIENKDIIFSEKNLNKIASTLYNTKYKNRYESKEDFVQSKFQEWLEKNDKVRERYSFSAHGNYKPEDYIFFIPTKKDGKLLYYPPAFKGIWGSKAEGSEIMGGLQERRVGLPFGSVSGIQADYDTQEGKGNYVQFAKDFDNFRKFLQEQ